jgi:hypothetical protein
MITNILNSKSTTNQIFKVTEHMKTAESSPSSSMVTYCFRTACSEQAQIHKTNNLPCSSSASCWSAAYKGMTHTSDYCKHVCDLLRFHIKFPMSITIISDGLKAECKDIHSITSGAHFLFPRL